jgi:hypothetical protein
MAILYPLAIGLGCLLVLWRPLSRMLDAFLLKTLTAMPQLEKLDQPRQGPRLEGTAIVAGGSIGGLLAACVLHRHFEKVVVIESEHLETDNAQRKLVPQAPHAHILLPFSLLA